MLKVAVFGTGHLGKFHLNNWKLIPEIEVVGFYDPNDEIAAGVSDKYQIQKVYGSCCVNGHMRCS